MGGSGSGNWYRFDKRATEENFWRFSVSTLSKHGVIEEGGYKSGSWHWLTNGETRCSIGYKADLTGASPLIRVQYTNKATEQKYEYPIRLTHTTPHYGGKRWWFICPAKGCGRRVGVLYLSNIFACRHCHHMAYSSQNEPPHYRALHKAQAIHQALGGSGCVDEPLSKPKHMHWRTFYRKQDEMYALDQQALFAAAKVFGIDFNS